MKRSTAAVVACIVAATAAAMYFGPHWTVYRMRSAVESKDAHALSTYIDFPSVRESFKAQFLTMMGKTLNTAEMKDNPFAGLGQAFALGMVNQLTDTLISPAGVMAMLQKGDASVKPIAAPGDTGAKPPKYSIAYVNYSTAEIRPQDGGTGKFILRRDGFFSWKLSAIELPN